MYTKRLFHLVITSMMVAMAILLVGCGAINAQAPTDAPKDVINYQMGWVHEYSSSAFYMAIANGHYAKENLDVKLSVGGFSDKGYIDPVEQVVSGAADFSEASVFT